MDRFTIESRCAALFASALQRSDAPSGDAVADAVSRAVRQFGIRGCVGLMAQEFGDHPETAMDRMRWILQLVGGVHPAAAPKLTSPTSAEQPATARLAPPGRPRGMIRRHPRDSARASGLPGA